MVDFPFTNELPNVNWNNYHASIPPQRVEQWLLFESHGGPPMAEQGTALKAILGHCFQQGERLAVMGSRWSLSEILRPDKLVLDPGALNSFLKVPTAWLDPAYKATLGTKVPVLVGGGARIRQINDELGTRGLALPTSGAADGHRIAGCIATGTHGADIKVGAVHDYVRAVVLMVDPNKLVVVQPSAPVFDDDLRAWLQKSTGITTENLASDDVLRAAQVAVGGLGVVYAVLIEAVPLYDIVGVQAGRTVSSQDIWKLIDHLDPSGLGGPADPDILAVMMFQYARPDDPKGAVASVAKKQPTHRPFGMPGHAAPMIATDTSRVVTALGPLLGQAVGDLAEHLITSLGQGAVHVGPYGPEFPSNAFGPTTLPPGNGTSTEVAVPRAHAGNALRTLLDVFKQQAAQRRYHFGAESIRFVRGSQAHLAMNRGDGTTYIEVAGLKTVDAPIIQKACWDALRSENIPFTCHWGKQEAMTREQIAAYYGTGIAKWKAARDTLLSAQGKKVFTNPVLQRLGLG